MPALPDSLPQIRPGRAPEAPRPLPSPAEASEPLGVMLLREGHLAPHRIVAALRHGGRPAAPLADVLLAEGVLSEDEILAMMARRSGLPVLDPAAEPPDPRLIDRLGVRDCLREGLLPLRDTGSAVLIAAAAPESFHRHRPRLEELFGTVIPALATRSSIEAALHAVRADAIGAAAELRVAPEESCRDWRTGQVTRLAALAGLTLIAGLALSPGLVLLALTAWALLALACGTGLRLATAVATLRRRPPEPPSPPLLHLPMFSIIVALYREEDIAGRLVARLGRLDYPHDRLEILLVVEEADRRTRRALLEARLPPWMRIVISPKGSIRTKPRALNVALDHCRGSIVGVYDAEDAPEPDQIRRVVEGFSRRGSHVACLQGRLDYYNPRTNWLSRCFTIEYAAWFRLMLPGLDRLGLVVPLGGTTLFFRRAALEELGAWDAHNVTEDADLGIRLARHGYRTALIDTVTAEEANCRAIPWIKQRSRWIKGFMITWAVHMRAPRLLWRQLGPWRFAGFQVMFLGSISQTLLAPVLWSFWLLALGLPHPVAPLVPVPLLWSMIGLLLGSEGTAIALSILALRQTRHRLNPLWAPTLHLYNPLATFAAYKALWELLSAPFYWDKTCHGVFDAQARGRPLLQGFRPA
ncbi:glycosyltransferase [Cereibacter johrii]|uniref:glycosyltransferase n=1 Tax=Cereibacter johrii TaxID=445629 RepID=UPI003CF21459